MSKPTILLIGGSGFVSGTLAREALAQGYDVTVVTRGTRELPKGVKSIVADRKDRAAFRAAIAATKGEFDLVVDCIAFEPDDIKQCLECFAGRAKQFVMISTDFVYNPAKRKFPQGETDAQYVEGSYGGGKRACELELINARNPGFAWTVFRPCHIYGPGSLLGCSAPDNRDAKLIEKITAGRTLQLVGARLLQQPIFARDLAKLILSVKGNPRAHGQVFNAAGPEIIESWMYYQHIADTLGVPLKFEDQLTGPYLAANPDKAPFLCHRIYDLTRMKAAGLAAPSTPAADALREHVRSLLQ